MKMPILSRISRRRRRRGNALIEFVFLLPFYTACLFGILEFGNVYFVRLQLDNMTREGVRRAALGFVLSDIRETITHCQPSGVTNEMILIEYNNAIDGSGSWVAAGDDAGGVVNNIPQGYLCRVRIVNYQSSLITGAFFNFVPNVSNGRFTMSAQDIMVRE